MADQNQRRARLGAEREDEIGHLRAGGAVEIACRLVGEQYVRPGSERAGQRRALLLAAGKLRGVVAGARLEADGVQTGLGLVARRPVASKLKRQRDVFEGRQRRDQVERLEDDAHMGEAKAGERILAHLPKVVPERRHLAGTGAFEPAHEHEQRGFARARRPRQRDGFARGDGEGDAVKDGDRAGIAL